MALVALEIDLAALDDLGVEEEIVGHDHRAQDAHDDEQRTLGHRRHYGSTGGLAPVDVDEEELVDKRQSDDRHKSDDGALYLLVRIGKQQDEHHRRHQQRTRGDGDAQEHLQGDGAAEDLSQRGGDAGQDSADHDRTPHPARRVLDRRLAETQAGHDAEVGHIVLQGDEHDRRQRHHPEQGVAVGRTGGEVARPVARIDEAYRDQQSGADVSEYIKSTQDMRVPLALELVEDVHTSAIVCRSAKVYIFLNSTPARTDFLSTHSDVGACLPHAVCVTGEQHQPPLANREEQDQAPVSPTRWRQMEPRSAGFKV